MKLFPWEAALCEDEGCPQFGTPHVCVSRPELQRDLATGLWPGQEHPMDAPDFLNRATNPLATSRRS